jgi:hypothetical protein
MKFGIRAGLALGCVISLSACATVTRGSKEHFYIMSEPTGAHVKMTNGMTCVTPCDLKLKRKDEFQVVMSMPGYKNKIVYIMSDMRTGGTAALAGNVLIGGIVGGIIDSSSGAMSDLQPNPLKVILAPNGTPEESQVIIAEKPKPSPAGKKPASD